MDFLIIKLCVLAGKVNQFYPLRVFTLNLYYSPTLFIVMLIVVVILPVVILQLQPYVVIRKAGAKYWTMWIFWVFSF